LPLSAFRAVLTSAKEDVMQSVLCACHSVVRILSVNRSVSRITAKVIGRFHCYLVLWLDLPIGRAV